MEQRPTVHRERQSGLDAGDRRVLADDELTMHASNLGCQLCSVQGLPSGLPDKFQALEGLFQ